MEQNLPIIAKKFWSIVKVAYFMLRKGISKSNLLSDLNMMMKRGKIAGKAAMHNLLFNHHHHGGRGRGAAAQEPQLSYSARGAEYEFSCSRSPAFRLPFHLGKRKSSSPRGASEGEMWEAAVEMASSAAPSPALPGLGRAAAVRVTDSPFPVREIEEDHRVDEAAEKFITKFYRDLKKQNAFAS
ncbi:hypothetical protein SASPL_141906 [Salvia splendens]|uniref:Avr9/Cf-9 rapidly elicited protein 146 n=1 Tax=Salvia splendens TaxID=180675 RepID=A0A8X8WJM2_SALSN|nr:uncharacterized protein LOC121771911 [Salvia splendens]KAG6395780.1 hypothetical protein SASPL_141906 [Salvia splendens]